MEGLPWRAETEILESMHHYLFSSRMIVESPRLFWNRVDYERPFEACFS